EFCANSSTPREYERTKPLHHTRHTHLSYNDGRVLFQPLSAAARAQTMMGMSNPPAHPVSPIHVNKALHQQGPQAQQMGPDLQTNESMLSQMASMGQPYSSDQYGDSQLEELLRSGISGV
ncbi:6716_t:CDS:2, partial [Acaulospora colombiana]